jgi:hypothetical protein
MVPLQPILRHIVATMVPLQPILRHIVATMVPLQPILRHLEGSDCQLYTSYHLDAHYSL